MDQYLLLTRKTREEYLKEISPDAEKRVKRQLVVDEVARAEEIKVTPEEIESLFQTYAQAGQNLPRSDAQIRALASTYRREKTITRLVELTTDPDPDAQAEIAAEEETSVANAEAAALAGEKDVVAELVEASETGDFSEPATPPTGEATAEDAIHSAATATDM
jgi:trigger factor